MIELIDIDENKKYNAMIICGIKYGSLFYVLYSIKRDDDFDNLFVSKLVKNSVGYTLDNNFSGGEREALDGVVESILNMDSRDRLKENGIELFSDIEFVDINRFSVTKCYVTTYKRILIDNCINNYDLVVDNKVPSVVVKEKEVSYFSKSNRPIVYTILFLIFLVVFGVIVVINFIN